MKDPAPQPIYRKDYTPPAFLIDTVDLRVELGENVTVVHATLGVRRTGAADAALVLDGERLDLQSVHIDGTLREPERYTVEAATLQLPDVPDAFTLQTVVHIEPHKNTELSGLYRSGKTFCTQCEAEGFRRITYFLDRPDVMSVYSTTIVADKAKYPVLLSNGNAAARRDLDDGKHEVRWEDPHPKPSYLFALVAADLRCKAGTFTTMSGREVALEIWVEPSNVDACDHALRSLEKSMRWDEEVFGLEYDLDVYMIVAVSDFNMAAMENKGLNIFNAKYVLARPETATDDDYEDIEGVIGHEYFHNWTGNRVTCRDWFQLTLKEGLTVFRDEQFTADMTSPAVKRIRDVRLLRTSQFAEDASPTSHPIRPDSYIEMNNFYTVTVYNKGAEVIRMMHTLLGAEGFRKGMGLYFERHDGQAVTCDDFRAAMADATGTDLDQFGLWYAQSGTPTLRVVTTHDAQAQTFSITLEQQPPEGRDADAYQPMHIPVATGLLGPDGADLPLRPADSDVKVRGTTAILELRDAKKTFTFDGVTTPPTPSILRGFSAPVRVSLQRSPDELAFCMAHDDDAFSRWDAAQSFASDLLLAQAQRHRDSQALEADPRFLDAIGTLLADDRLDPALKALTLVLPEERLLGQHQTEVDVEGLHAARTHLRAALATAHADTLWSIYKQLDAAGRPYATGKDANGQRRLKNVAMRLLLSTGSDDAVDAALTQFRTADNMTDAQAALQGLVDCDHAARQTALDEFYAKWKQDPLVVDKWFAVQAASELPDTRTRVEALLTHEAMTLTNPNRVRSLLGSFSVRNQVRFHAADGKSYAMLADKVIELDRLNPQVAARLMSGFMQWRRFDAGRRTAMQDALRRIRSTEGLSPDVFELSSKALGED
ncbi:MAG: aminopeptidase N [Myxococcota bacterium]